MAKRNRSVDIAKWVGMLLCVALAVPGVISRWTQFGYECTAVAFYCDAGAFIVVVPGAVAGADPPRGWWRDQANREPFFWPEAGQIGPFRIYTLPLWIPFAFFALVTLDLWRKSRRHPPGCCRKCGYDLTGNVSGKCPECGTATRG